MSTVRTSCAGAITELRISADLMARGWQIFRAVSPGSSCDLVGMAPSGKLIRIECTTSKVNRAGVRKWTTHDPNRYDLICGVDRLTKELFYDKDPSNF